MREKWVSYVRWFFFIALLWFARGAQIRPARAVVILGSVCTLNYTARWWDKGVVRSLSLSHVPYTGQAKDDRRICVAAMDYCQLICMRYSVRIESRRGAPRSARLVRRIYAKYFVCTHTPRTWFTNKYVICFVCVLCVLCVLYYAESLRSTHGGIRAVVHRIRIICQLAPHHSLCVVLK